MRSGQGPPRQKNVAIGIALLAACYAGDVVRFGEGTIYKKAGGLSFPFSFTSCLFHKGFFLRQRVYLFDKERKKAFSYQSCLHVPELKAREKKPKRK